MIVAMIAVKCSCQDRSRDSCYGVAGQRIVAQEHQCLFHVVLLVAAIPVHACGLAPLPFLDDLDPEVWQNVVDLGLRCPAQKADAVLKGLLVMRMGSQRADLLVVWSHLVNMRGSERAVGDSLDLLPVDGACPLFLPDRCCLWIQHGGVPHCGLHLPLPLARVQCVV